MVDDQIAQPNQAPEIPVANGGQGPVAQSQPSQHIVPEYPPSALMPALDLPKKNFFWLAWIAIPLFSVLAFFTPLAFLKKEVSPSVIVNNTKAVDAPNKLPGFEQFAEEVIMITQTRDVAKIKQHLVSDFLDRHQDEDIDKYLEGICAQITAGKIEGEPVAVHGTDELGQPQMTYRRTMTINNNSYILNLVIVKDSDTTRLYDISVESVGPKE